MENFQKHLLHVVALVVAVIPFCASWLSVNELYLRIDGSTSTLPQFVELKCYRTCEMHHSAYKLVFVDSESVYKVIDLSTRSAMSHNELLLIGPASVNPDIDWGNFVIHLDSPSCVALYSDQENNVITGSIPPYKGLYSWIVFTMHNPISLVPLDLFFFYGKTQYTSYPVPEADRSFSKCKYWRITNTPPTPKIPNRCSSDSEAVEVVINELNAASPRNDRHEFVELLNIAHVPVHLGDYTLVLYDGRNNTAYKVIPLMNATLPAGDFYVIGSSRLNPHPEQIFEEGSLRTLQNGADAVALYKVNGTQYQVNMSVTDVGLVDAVVYDSRGRHSEILTAVLTPGELTLHEDWGHLPVDESLSRCNGSDPRTPSQFRLARRSPGDPNRCTPPTPRSPFPTSMPGPSVSPLVINEFSLELSNQYIELYDGGMGDYALDGLLIALYSSRSMRAYTDTIVLNGFKTDANGYFLIKAGDTTSDTEVSFSFLSTIDLSAIALYNEHANNIVRGSLVTSENLVDVILYGTPVVNRQVDLVDALLPGATPLGMDDIMLAFKSYSRCRGWSSMQMSSFTITNQSPSSRNNCPLPQVVINEVDLTATVEGRFIELYSNSPSDFSLDGVVLLIFQKQSLMPQKYFTLDGYSINDRGFVTIGHENGTNVDYAIDKRSLDWTTDIGAIALYLGSAQRFEYSKQAVDVAIVDALVLSNSGDPPDLDLMNALTPHQNQVNDLDNSTSISRCRCCTPKDSDSFGNGAPSPGSINEVCQIGTDTMTESLPYHQQLLRINEVYTTPGGNGLFIELYDAGYSGVKMNQLSLSLFSPSNGGIYSSYDLQKEGSLGKTDENGFYTIGTASSGVALNVQVHDSERFLRSTTNAIVLWKNDLGQSSRLESLAGIERDKVIDVMVFGEGDYFDYNLLQRFTSLQPNITVNSTFMTGAFSISRCHSQGSGEQLAFAFSTPTPKAANNCPMPPVVINEFNVIVYGYDMGEFIEISSLGIPNFPLSNIIVVLYSRNGRIYRRYAINDRKTDHNGFFLLGYRQVKYPAPDMPVFPFNGNYIRNGPDAIALHRGTIADYPVRKEVTNSSLIDAVVYGVWGDYVAQNLIDVLTPGREQAFEVTSVSEMDESISRCIEGGKPVYKSVHISPKFPNLCPYSDVKLVISEVNLEVENQFIEIWDFGLGLMSLDNVSIVLFDKLGQNYMEIPLNGYRTEAVGYFVLGTTSVTPRSQFANIFAPGFIRTTSGAVTLYKASNGVNPQRRTVQDDGLLDAVVYSDGVEALAAPLIQTLSPNTPPIPSLLLQEEGSSVSRCFSSNQTTSAAFSIRPPTSLSLNDCPVFETDVIINEINVDNIDNNPTSADFIELYDGGRGNTSLDYLTLVLFDGGHNDRSYMTVGLDGYRTNEEGYFVIGASTSMADPDISLPPTGFLHQGPDGVAIYRAPSMAFTYGTMAVGQSVVDGIVYSLFDEASMSLEAKLTPGFPTFRKRLDPVDTSRSISRCYGNHRRNPTKFGVAVPSPGKPNSCSTASAMFTSVVINEIYIDSEYAQKEYIELYDFGAGGTSLDGFSLVFFDGANQDRSYYEVDLNGERTDANGFFTIGRSNPSFTPNKAINHKFIQNGPDAVVLYRKPISSFPRASVATAEGMVDVLIYGTNDDVKTTLIDKLTPGQIQINEQQLHLDVDKSLSRCLSNDTINLAAFITSFPTPGAANNCTLYPVYINEINFDSSKREKSDFIELFDGSRGFTSLDSVVLVLFSEFSRSAFNALPLQNNRTDINGFFTIGGADIQADLTIDSSAFWGLLAKYPGAVGLYRGDHRDFQLGMAPSTTNLMDAVILGSEGNPATVLGAALLPDQPQILEEKFYLEGDESVSRCKCCNALRMADFALGPSSLQAPNSCTQMGRLVLDQPLSGSQFIVISEVKMSSNDEGQLPMDVELYGTPGMSLDSYVLVYYSVLLGDTKAYFIISLSGTMTDDKGYFTLTQERAADLESLDRYPMRTTATVGAVGLYDRIRGVYSYGMSVTDMGLVDAVTFTDGSRDVTALQAILNPVTKPVMSSVTSENYLGKYKQLSLSRCWCCDVRNNSVFTLSGLTSGQPNMCPKEKFGTTVQLRLTNAVYSQWKSNDAWRSYLQEKIVEGVESICQCGFTVAYLSNERLLEGSVVYEVLLMGIDEEQSKLILRGFRDFVKRNATITIMDQIFMLDHCTENCLSGERGRRVGGKGGVAASVIGTLFLVILIVVLVALGWLYRNHIHMLYLKTIKARGSSDGVQFNNNQNVAGETNLDEGIVNPVYEGNSQSGAVTLSPQFQDPAANPRGEQPYVVTC